MLNTNFSCWPSFTEEEADAVRNVILSNKVNYWTGQETRTFEKEFAAWSGTEYAVALANGTVALDLALKVLGVGSGDEVVVTSRTFWRPFPALSMQVQLPSLQMSIWIHKILRLKVFVPY